MIQRSFITVLVIAGNMQAVVWNINATTILLDYFKRETSYSERMRLNVLISKVDLKV